jgi:hypothetical protein
MHYRHARPAHERGAGWRPARNECLESICLVEAAIVCKEPPSVESYEEELVVRQGTILALNELDVDFFSC